MTQASSQESSSNLGEGWNVAKKASTALGYMPTSFSVAVRTLLQDHVDNKGVLSASTKYQVGRLLKGPTFLSMLYYAVKFLRPNALADKKYWTVGSMMSAFTPMDLAALISSFVFYRKSQKMLSKNGRWDSFAPIFDKEPCYGAQIGAFVPDIGIGNGLLVSTFRHFGMAAMALQGDAQYKACKKFLSSKPHLTAFADEEAAYGCSSAQVAVFLLAQVGVGPQFNHGFTIAVDRSVHFSSVTDAYALPMKMACLWIDSAIEGLDQPRDKIPARFFPKPTEHQVLKDKLKAIRDGQICWLQRNKDDVSETKTPELFSKDASESEIPEQLRDMFSMEEITSMEEEDFDDLIDQIDAENEGRKTGRDGVLDAKDLNELEKMVDE